MVRKVSDPTPVPVPGNKVIDEYEGRANTDNEAFSVAHMVAPPGWSEPFQKPEFDEFTVVIKGTLRVEHEGGVTDTTANQTVFVTAGERVRYSNPFDTPAEYWAICVPAFHPDKVHREPA